MKYKKVLGTLLSKVENDFVIVKGTRAYKVNEVSSRIFDLCNGKNDVTYISELLSKFYNISQDEIKKDIDEFIEVLLNEELIKKVNG